MKSEFRVKHADCIYSPHPKPLHVLCLQSATPAMFKSVFNSAHGEGDRGEAGHWFKPFAEERVFNGELALHALCEQLFEIFRTGNVHLMENDPGFLLNLASQRVEMMEHMQDAKFRVMFVTLINQMNRLDPLAVSFAKGVHDLAPLQSVSADDPRTNQAFKRCNAVFLISGIINRLIPEYHPTFLAYLFKGKEHRILGIHRGIMNYWPDNCEMARTYSQNAMLMMNMFISALPLGEFNMLKHVHPSIGQMQLQRMDPSAKILFTYAEWKALVIAMHDLNDFLKKNCATALELFEHARHRGGARVQEDDNDHHDSVTHEQVRIMQAMDSMMQALIPELYYEFIGILKVWK